MIDDQTVFSKFYYVCVDLDKFFWGFPSTSPIPFCLLKLDLAKVTQWFVVLRFSSIAWAPARQSSLCYYYDLLVSFFEFCSFLFFARDHSGRHKNLFFLKTFSQFQFTILSTWRTKRVCCKRTQIPYSVLTWERYVSFESNEWKRRCV